MPEDRAFDAPRPLWRQGRGDFKGVVAAAAGPGVTVCFVVLRPAGYPVRLPTDVHLPAVLCQATIRSCHSSRPTPAGWWLLSIAFSCPRLAPTACHTPAMHPPWRPRMAAFHVYTSGLSRHTANLALETGLVSILFIENERDSKQPFARRRVSFRLPRPTVVERDSARVAYGPGRVRDAVRGCARPDPAA